MTTQASTPAGADRNLWGRLTGTITGSKRRTEQVQHLGIHALLILGAIVVMIPLAWMVSTSFKAPNQVKVFPPIWIPNPFVWENYVRAVTIYPVPFYIFIWNTFFYSAMVTIGTILSNMTVAYAFARLRVPFSRVLFMIVLATMMLPSQVTMIPLFILFSKLGWVNTYKPLIIPAFFGWAYFVFPAAPVLHDHLASGRRSASTAAASWESSSASSSRSPSPPSASLAIFAPRSTWNDFMGPLIYLNKLESYLLAIALSYLQRARAFRSGASMVVSMIAMLRPRPILHRPAVLHPGDRDYGREGMRRVAG